MIALLERKKVAVVLVRFMYLLVCAGAIVTYLRPAADPKNPVPVVVDDHPVLTFLLLLGITQSVTIIDLLVRKKRIEVISAIYFGLMIGFLLSFLVVQAIRPVFTSMNLDEYYQNVVVMVLSLTITYI